MVQATDGAGVCYGISKCTELRKRSFDKKLEQGRHAIVRIGSHVIKCKDVYISVNKKVN